MQNVLIHHYEVAETADQDEDVKNFVEAEDIRPWIRSFTRVDYGADGVSQPTGQ